MSQFLKAVLYLLSLILVVGLLLLVLGYFRISSYAFKTYESIDSIPHNKVGLLFGTSPLNSDGTINEYFTYRIMAASQLYKAGKIEYILVSGDNQHKSYNEPRLMKKALVKAGVPSEKIVFDFAGIRTLDSVIRARKVFLLKNVTFISQEFQNERALFIADRNELNGVGYNAMSPEKGIFNKVALREFFARIMCVLDVYILNTQPKFLGKPEAIGKGPLPKELSNKPKRLTSALKKLTDNAEVMLRAKLIAKYEPVAKKTTDSARFLRAQEERMIRQESVSPVLTEGSDLARQQGLLLSQAENDALEEASETASESLNAGNSTYIDPHAREVNSDTERSEVKTVRKPRTIRRHSNEETANVSHGDPWD
ncbi:MAG: vancomycin high temperature exclusion protein [Succinivibrio sp.]